MIATDCALRLFLGGGENAGGLWPSFFFVFGRSIVVICRLCEGAFLR